MKQIDITLTVRTVTKDDIDLEWRGYLSETPGLAVARRPRFVSEQGGDIAGFKALQTADWQVIHLASGWPLHNRTITLRTRAAALRAATELAPLRTWTKQLADMRLTRELLDQTNAILLKHGKAMKGY